MLAANVFKLSRSELFEASFRSIDAIFADEKVKTHLKYIWSQWKELHANEF